MLMQSHLKLPIPIALLLLATAAIAASDKPAKDGSGPLQLPIAGSAASGGTFVGTFSINRFEARAGQELVQHHTVVGSQMVSMHPGLEGVAAFVRGHHERWDGLGYPDRLAGEMIPWGARVLAAAEVYDALTAARCYQQQTTETEALARLAELRGTVIDPSAYLAVIVFALASAGLHVPLSVGRSKTPFSITASCVGPMIAMYRRSSSVLRCFGVGRYSSIAGWTLPARCTRMRISSFSAAISSDFVRTMRRS